MNQQRTWKIGRQWLSVLGITLSLSCACGSVTAREKGWANQRYEFKGVIKSVNKTQKTAVIRHERVGDYMEPMTMPFFIRDEKALSQLEPRDQIVATLVVTKSAGEWLEDIFIVAKGR